MPLLLRRLLLSISHMPTSFPASLSSSLNVSDLSVIIAPFFPHQQHPKVWRNKLVNHLILELPGINPGPVHVAYQHRVLLMFLAPRETGLVSDHVSEHLHVRKPSRPMLLTSYIPGLQRYLIVNMILECMLGSPKKS